MNILNESMSLFSIVLPLSHTHIPPHHSGVQVRLLASNWSNSSPQMFQYLASLNQLKNVQVKLYTVPTIPNQEPYTRVNHAKYMVTDKAAYIGTNNWTGDYFVFTGGVSLTTQDNEAIRSQLQAVFDRDWSSPYATFAVRLYVSLSLSPRPFISPSRIILVTEQHQRQCESNQLALRRNATMVVRDTHREREREREYNTQSSFAFIREMLLLLLLLLLLLYNTHSTALATPSTNNACHQGKGFLPRARHRFGNSACTAAQSLPISRRLTASDCECSSASKSGISVVLCAR